MGFLWEVGQEGRQPLRFITATRFGILLLADILFGYQPEVMMLLGLVILALVFLGFKRVIM